MTAGYHLTGCTTYGWSRSPYSLQTSLANILFQLSHTFRRPCDAERIGWGTNILSIGTQEGWRAICSEHKGTGGVHPGSCLLGTLPYDSCGPLA